MRTWNSNTAALLDPYVSSLQTFPYEKRHVHMIVAREVIELET